MRFKIGEHLPLEIKDLLAQHRHDPVAVPEEGMAGSIDPDVAQVCRKEARALLALDLDFSDIRTYPPPQDYHDIVVFRPAIQSITTLARLTTRVLTLLEREPLRWGLTLLGKVGKLRSYVTTNFGGFDMRMGLREANQSFSKAMKAVKQGKDVVLTERGRPIAVIKPLDPKEDQETVIRRLEAEGILRPALKRGPMPKPTWKPIRVKGKLMSQTISEERDER